MFNCSPPEVEVAKVWLDPVWPFREVNPPPAPASLAQVKLLVEVE
jgi:hypothetical protein